MALIQLRRGTAAQWTSANPTLSAGEIGIETDTLFIKVGNGSTSWTSLTYAAGTVADNAVTNAKMADDAIGLAELNTTGTPSSANWLRGDMVWAAPAGSGDASTNTGTSVDGEVVLFSGTGGKTLKRATVSGISKLTSGVQSSAVAGTDYVSPNGVETLTNKRITKRVATTTSSATPTINTDTVDMFGLTAQAVDITSFTTNLTGTPTNGQPLWIYIVPTATRAITWGASFEGSLLPSSAPGTTRLDVGLVWNSVTSKWKCVGVA